MLESHTRRIQLGKAKVNSTIIRKESYGNFKLPAAQRLHLAADAETALTPRVSSKVGT